MFVGPFFRAYLISTGELIGCSAYWGDEQFSYGNIQIDTFKDVWHSDKRRQSFEFVSEKLDICECRKGCRMDVVNDYLEIKAPTKS